MVPIEFIHFVDYLTTSHKTNDFLSTKLPYYWITTLSLHLILASSVTFVVRSVFFFVD